MKHKTINSNQSNNNANDADDNSNDNQGHIITNMSSIVCFFLKQKYTNQTYIIYSKNTIDRHKKRRDESTAILLSTNLVI